MNDNVFLKKGFSISTDQNLLDFDSIYNYLDKESYWSKGVPVDKLRNAISNSICFGVYKENKQAGFARIISDKATFAYVCDLFILPAYRGAGLSKWLVQTVINHPELQGLRRWSLGTADAHGLYSQFGFTPITQPEIWMQIYKPYQVLKKED
jgi:GNAT superfamily N-acetyltransferase